MGNFVLQCMFLLVAVNGLLQCSVTAQNTQRMIDVRLAGGSNSSSGIVELRSLIPLTGWQDFFCGYNSFRYRVSVVVCRMLGFQTIASYSSTRINMNGNFLSPPFCNGDERSINECNGSYHFTTHCDYRYEITCSTCEIGAVRLTNGLVPEQGIVEICLNGSWFRLCYHENWGYRNSFVVCRQLGYPATKAEYTNSSIYTSLHPGYMLSSLSYNCVGDENSLYNCTSETSSTCEHYNSAGYSSDVIVLCKGEIAENCTDGVIRLSGGRDQYEGRVEVCSNGLWRTISRSGWDSNDAMVACRQLGLLQPHTLTRVTMSSFGPGEGPISFRQMKCNGNESSLNQCQRITGIYYHSGDAGVRCQFNPSTVYTNCNNDIRLVGGNSVSEGRVEICFNGVWGSVCNYRWDDFDATVVCRKLGFQAENSTAINDLRYGEGSGPYLLYNVSCRGHERNLTECQYGNSQIGYHVCSSKQDAGVICDASTCHHGDIRLFGGYSKSDGIAEICINGQWTSICSQGWDETDSIQFCRQLLGRENVVALYSTCCSKIRSTSVAAVSNVRCNASPSTPLVNCSFEQGYNPSYCSLIIVGCYLNDSCNYGSVRLVNERTRNEGIVEVCLNGVWSNIKYSGWNTPGAEVVCRQLGMSWEWSQYYYVRLRDYVHYSPSLLQDVNCVGDEDMLLNCIYSKLSSSQSLHRYYSYHSIAAVLCQGSTTQSNNPNECIFGEVRLANQSNNVEGRVEICTEGTWVSVCDSYWGIEETHAFCKQLLGHPVKGSFHITNGYYGTGNHPIISQVSCYNSDSFNSCRITHQGYCSHGEDVGVVCQESYYAVTVTSITDPPFELGSNVKLHCSINHDPSVGRPVQLQYSWRGNDGHSYYGPNITVLIPVTHYKTSYYYCKVSVRDSVIGVGSILIETKDILNPIDVPPSQSYGYHFALAVNVSDQIKSIVRELNWYFNGNLIANFYNTNDNKTLMTTVGNPGVYEVRYDGLLALPHNRECESTLLSVMRHYPMFKPVRFYVNTTEELFPQTSTIMTLWRNSAEDVVFTDGDDITLTAVGKTHLFVEQRDHITIKWFVNGFREYSHHNYDNMHGYAQFSSKYRLTNATYQSRGKYETLLIWNIHTYTYYHSCYHYYYSLRRELFLDLYDVILAKSSIELKYYESLNHSFSATKSSLSSSEVSLLTCSATIHYPPLTNVSIVKNKIILKTAVNATLTVSTKRLGVSPFGLYQCRVDASGVPFTRELMIKEKVSLRIELQIKQSLKCSTDNDFVEVMESSVAIKLNDSCSCNVTAADLRDTQIMCNSESSMVFTTLLVFSTESGDETASTLANRLSGQVSFSALTIDINGSEALITTAVITSSTAGRNSDSVGTNIGVFIGGVIFSAIFIALFLIILMICRRKSFKNSNPPATIAMSENACYSSEKSEVRVNLEDDSKDDSKDVQDAVYEEISIKNDDD